MTRRDVARRDATRSALYEGWMVHHRVGTPEHRFAYRVSMPLLFLDEIDAVMARSAWWSAGVPAPVWFRRRDFYGDRTEPLHTQVLDAVEHQLGRRPAGPVALLANLRTWGWLFNPIALYYCFDGDVVSALAMEVTNTPWHERHLYVVGAPGRHQFAKALHVSPFMTMDHQYQLDYDTPHERLPLTLTNLRDGEPVFTASLRLRRRPLEGGAMAALPWRLPTHSVSTGIYRQAFSLWRKGAEFVPRPRRASRAATHG